MNILFEISRGVWMIPHEYAVQYLPFVVNVFSGKNNLVPDNIASVSPEERTAFLNYSPNRSVVGTLDILLYPERINSPSVFRLDIIGVITKYDQFCGTEGMLKKAQWLKQADQHHNVFAHFINIDSGGGEGYASSFMAETIKSLKKPVVAFINDVSASAGYMIAASADYIVANSYQAQVGSIGTYVSIYDYKEYFESMGIRIIDVYADDSTHKNKDYHDAIKVPADIAGIKKKVNFFNNAFLQFIKNQRGGKLKSDNWTTGEVFFAQDAVDIGLIDAVDSLDNTINEIFLKYSS